MVARRITAVVCAWVALAISAPSAAAWEPAGGAVFNDPQGGFAARWRIVQHIDDAVRRTPSGQRILISSYLMDSVSSADALVAAHARGVHVKIVLDGDQGNTAVSRRLAGVLNADNIDPDTGEPYRDENGRALPWGPDRSFVVFCKGSCRGDRTMTNNHSKFYLFSRTGTARNVVMVSSSNLNRGGAVRGWNDALTVKGKPAMFQDYASIFREMAQDTPLDGDRFREVTRGRYTSRFFPLTVYRDPVLEDLARVRCRGATGGAGRKGRTAIHVAMFAFLNERGEQIARRLVELDNRGCDVSVIYGAPSREVADILKRSARRGGVRLWDSRRDLDGDRVPDLRTHEKYMLINGVYAGDTSSWQVHTGSQNWGQTLMNGDDVTLNVESRFIHAQYLANWRSIARYGARRIR
jgi:hypothetical protein